MAKFNSIEEINVWKEGIDLAELIYSIIRKNKPFLNDFGLKDQVQRSAVSISSNIAEGFERESNKEFIRYLYIAKGSCGELRTQILIAFRLHYLTESDFTIINNMSMKISGMIMNLIKSLKLLKP